MSTKIRLALHKNVQQEIKTRLIGQNTTLEKKFSAINRIADVYWQEANIVFEIQCSPIPLIEAINRTRDYQSIAITVIWLLHDKTFNRNILSKSERYLREHKALYTNIDGLNQGVIYNQQDQLLYRTRVKRGRAIPINILDHKHLRHPLKQPKFKKKTSIRERYERLLTKLYNSL